MNNDLYGQYIADLKLKGYQKRSIQSYVRAVRQLQNFCCKAPEDIREEEVREYWLYCKEELGWGSATLRISYSGVKLFYGQTLKRDWEVLRAVKFERDQTLPVVLNIDEVRAILRNLPNLANRAFFTLVYACGLRLGEALNLQVADVDGQRQVLRAIRACRSGECGHHVFACPACGTRQVANSSCGNRHCPICQNEKAAAWMYRREQDLLPCTYFLATFTLPEAVQAVAWQHPSGVYDALFVKNHSTAARNQSVHCPRTSCCLTSTYPQYESVITCPDLP
jgi:integrase